MIWSDFKAKVLEYCDVDKDRRGITAFRDSFIKAGVIDLKHFVDSFKDDIDGADYADGDIVPFFPHDEKSAEAVAMYFKSRVARAIDKDLSMMMTYVKDFEKIRRLLMRESSNVLLAPKTIIKAMLGQTVPFTIKMAADENDAAWPGFSFYRVDFSLVDDQDVVVRTLTSDGGEVVGAINLTSDTASWELNTTGLKACVTYVYTINLVNIPLERTIPLRQGQLLLSP